MGIGDGTFQPPVTLPVQQRPKFAEVGDINNDGKLDLAIANEVSNSVTVLLGNGNGTFQSGVHTAAGCVSPHEISVGELNGDNRPDVVIPCWDGNVISVLFGNGNGSFQTAVNYTTGTAPHSAVIGDFNKDGRNDIAVANYQSNNLTVLLSSGPGTFAAPVPYSTAALPHFVRAADVNKDGNLDLFTANDGAHNVSVLLGSGAGTFAAAMNFPTGSMPESVTSGDVNGDGNLDLVTANSGTTDVSVLLGTGTGSFAAPANFAAGPRAFHAILAHLNGDQNLDIAVANYGADFLSVLLSLRINPLPPGSVYLSDRSWTTETNGWGPAEKDRSNGESAAGDGNTIQLNGVGYGKGLGVHAQSEIRYNVAGCSGFIADIGVDDEVGSRGSVVFEVWGDATRLFESGVVTGDTPARRINVSIAGRNQLRLIVTDAGDGPAYDHGDWADAQINCTADTTRPTVNSVTPAANSSNVPPTSPVTAVFSEQMDSASLTTTTFTLTPQGGSPVAATVSYDVANSTGVLTPAAPLAPGVLHTATVKGGPSGAKDSSGNALLADFPWSFTTGTQATTPLSSRAWTLANNGWGPVEIDKSNGEQGAGDGQALIMNGVTYPKGLGVHAPSEIRYAISGCSAFTARVGVDDEVGSSGSVTFEVWGDSVKLFDSGVMTGTSATGTVNVSLAGRSELRLIVTNGGDGPNYDHADWGNPELACSQDATAPSVLTTLPAANAVNTPVTAAVTARFSEPMTAATLTTTTVRLTKQGSATPVLAVVSYNANSNSVTLTPGAALDSNSVYTATIRGGSAGAKDWRGIRSPSCAPTRRARTCASPRCRRTATRPTPPPPAGSAIPTTRCGA